MNYVQQMLVAPIILYIILACILAFFSWSELTGKCKPRSWKSVGEDFEKRFPGLLKKLTIGCTIFLGVLMGLSLYWFTLDFIKADVNVTHGTVVRIERAGRSPPEILLDNNKNTYFNWFGRFNIKLGEYYEIHYTPLTKTIVRVLRL
jgi:hypothetical protein